MRKLKGLSFAHAWEILKKDISLSYLRSISNESLMASGRSRSFRGSFSLSASGRRENFSEVMERGKRWSELFHQSRAFFHNDQKDVGLKNFKFGWGSICATHLAAPGSILGDPKNYHFRRILA